MNSQQAQLHLLDGEMATDLESLAKLYKKLTGREPTPAELGEAEHLLRSVGEISTQ